MNKPLAVIDNCLFREICEVESESEREGHWTELYQRYQLVVPFVLIEEAIATIVRPGKTTQDVCERMQMQLAFLKPCWMEDLAEVAFTELVEKRPLMEVPTPSDATVSDLLRLRREDPRLIQWADDRVRERKQTARQRKDEQERLLKSATATHVGSYRKFFERIVRPEFMRTLGDAKRKRELLENALGHLFRKRHPEAVDRIDAAFADFGPKTFSRHPFTTNYLTVRLAYLFAPAITVPGDLVGERRRILPGTASDQFNNAKDEEYLVAALGCLWLLTQDSGLNVVATLFREVGLWRGDSILFDPNVPLSCQIPNLLR